jgi:ammonia channel protein AmtB
MAGVVAIVGWTGITCFIMFSLLKRFNLLRVGTDMEFKGMDQIKHGEAGKTT